MNCPTPDPGVYMGRKNIRLRIEAECFYGLSLCCKDTLYWFCVHNGLDGCSCVLVLCSFRWFKVYHSVIIHMYVSSAAWNCGFSPYENAGIPGGTIPSPSIVDGWLARQHEFPWQVGINECCFK